MGRSTHAEDRQETQAARDPVAAAVDVRNARRLAAALIGSACESLNTRPPPDNAPAGADSRTLNGWKSKWRAYYRKREVDRMFLLDPSRSAWWCEAAGYHWGVLIECLESRGALWPTMDVVPDTVEIPEGEFLGAN